MFIGLEDVFDPVRSFQNLRENLLKIHRTALNLSDMANYFIIYNFQTQRPIMMMMMMMMTLMKPIAVRLLFVSQQQTY